MDQDATTTADRSDAARLDTTLVKGVDILTALCRSDTPLGISTLSSALGIGKSNVHRLLSTLIELGFVEKEEGMRRYSPTLKLWEVGSGVVERNQLYRAARPVMRWLRDESGEAAVLAVLSGTDILYMQKLGIVGVNTPSRAGLRIPALFPATGKALLAHQPDGEALLDQLLATAPQAYSVQRDALLKEFETIRQEGLAFSTSGWTRDSLSMAAIIPNGALPPIAAIGVASTIDRTTMRQLRQMAPLLRQAASRVAELIVPGTMVS